MQADNGDVCDSSVGSPDCLVLERDDEVRPRPGEFGRRDASGGFIGQAAEVELEVLVFLLPQCLEPVERWRHMIEANVKGGHATSRSGEA